MDDSSNLIISSDDISPATNDELSVVIPSETLNPTVPLFFPKSYFFSPPYFISDTNLFPPSIFMYHPLWYVNPNPNRFEFIEELPPLYSRSPSQDLFLPSPSRNRVFRRRRSNTMTWRRRRQIKQHFTTVMLRHIPNGYTREMMIEFMDMHCEEANKKEKDEESPISAYDFLYLPIDFKSGMNRGYALVNFINKEAVSKFKAACNHKPWAYFNSRKVLEIAYARIQGKDELMKHFEQITYPAKAYSAVCFSPARSGPKNTVQTIMVGQCIEEMVSVYA